MKNPKKYLVSGVVGLSLMAGSLGYVYNLDFNKELVKESAAITETLPLSDEQPQLGSIIAATIPIIQTNPTETVPKAAPAIQSTSKSVAANTQQSTSKPQVATPVDVAVPAPSASVPLTETPITIPSQTTETQNNTVPATAPATAPVTAPVTTTPAAVVPSTVVTQPAPAQSTQVTTKTTTSPASSTTTSTKKTTTSTKKTSSTKAS